MCRQWSNTTRELWLGLGLLVRELIEDFQLTLKIIYQSIHFFLTKETICDLLAIGRTGRRRKKVGCHPSLSRMFRYFERGICYVILICSVAFHSSTLKFWCVNCFSDPFDIAKPTALVSQNLLFLPFGSTTEFVPFTSNYNFGLNFPSIHLTQSKQRAIYYTQIILICTLLLEARGWFWMYLRVLHTNNFDVYSFIGTKTQVVG